MQTENTILITAVRNPFRPYESRVTLTLDYTAQTVAEYLAPILPSPIEEFEIVASVNGKIVEADFVPLPRSSIVFTQVPAGGGNNQSMRTVASIALMAVSIYVGRIDAAWAIYASIGIAVGGSILINALLPLSLSESEAASASYSFSGVNSISEGIAFPVIYGTAKIVPPYIGMYMENYWGADQSTPAKQGLNVLCAIADHSVISIDDIKINGLDYDSYNYVTVDNTKKGSLSQSVITKFRDTHTSTSPNIRMDVDPTNTWSDPISVPGSDITGIRVGLAWPNGVAYTNSDGNKEALYVRYRIQFRLANPAYGPNDGWIDWIKNAFYFCRYTSQRWEHTTLSSSYDNLFSVWNGTNWDPLETPLRVGSSLVTYEYGYEIRWMFRGELPTDEQNADQFTFDTYIDYIAGINEDDFTYPGASLLSVHAMASDELSGGLPTISTVVTRGNITVYEEDGTPHSVSSNNPAWVCYDILHNDEYGCNVSYTRFNYSEFNQWATFCSTNSYECNIVYDTNLSVPDALARASILGRGHVIQRGTKFGVVIDQTSSPVQLFTMGNIIEDSLKVSYLSQKDRVNAIETKYIDSVYDYEERSFELRTSDFDTDTDMDENKIELTLYGATSKTIALELTQFLLNCNEYLKQSVEFEVDVDALASNVGDVILVSHDAPAWGYSGRVVSSTNNTITIDREVTCSVGITYKIIVRHYDDDDLEEVTLANPGTGDFDTFTLASGNWGQNPAADDVYAFGQENYVYNEFRITRITRTQEMRRKITALEYNAAVYSDAASIPDYEDHSDLEFFVEDLVAAETFLKEDGIIRSVVTLTWKGFGTIYIFYKEQFAADWEYFKHFSGSNSCQIRNLETGRTYIFAASTTRIALYDNCYDTLTIQGYVEPRLVHIWRVSGLQIVGQGSNTIFQNKDLKLTWNLSTQWFPEAADGDAGGAGSFPPMTDFGGYRIKILDQNNNVRREFIQTENYFNYTYEMNSEDGYTGRLYFISGSGSFTEGEWIYQNPSGAYAKIETVTGAYLDLTNIVGTFVNGQMIYQTDDYGNEILTDGDCSSDSFSHDAGWSYDSGNEEYDCDGSDLHSVYQYVLTPGNFYKFAWTIKNTVAGGITPLAGAGVGETETGDGTYTQHLYCPSSTYAAFRSSSFQGSIDDMSVKQTTNAALASGTVAYSSVGTAGDPEPNLIIQVWARNRFGQESAVPAVLSVSNPAPAAPSGLTVTSFLKGMKAVWQKNSEIDIDHYVYRTRVESDSWSSWTKVTNTEVVRILTPTEQTSYGSDATIYIEVKAIDTFGLDSSTSSGNVDAAGLYISVDDISGELYSSLTISDSEGNSESALADLYDRKTSTGGIAYSVTGSDQWIEYEYPLQYIIDRVCVWTSVAATVKAFVAYTEDDVTWNWLACDSADNHALNSDGELKSVANQTAAAADYWLLTESAGNNNMAIFPAQIVAKKARLYMTASFSATLREVVFVRQVIAEQVVADQLSAITAAMGSLETGTIQSLGLAVDSGTFFDFDSETLQFGGTNVSYAGTTKGIFIGDEGGGAYKLFVGDPSAAYLKIDTDDGTARFRGSFEFIGGSTTSNFSETWEEPFSWNNWTTYETSPDTVSIATGSESVSGGSYIRIGDNSGNDSWYGVSNVKIPFNPSKVYKMSCRIRRTYGSGTCYVGWVGWAGDQTTMVNINGSDSNSNQHYHCTAGTAPTSWTVYTGYSSGTSATGNQTAGTLDNPSVFHSSVRYISPMFLVNYSGQAGTYEIDYINVEILDNEVSTWCASGDVTKIDGGNIYLSSSLAINDATFGNEGFQVQYNSGTPRIYIGDGSEEYLKYDGTNISYSTAKSGGGIYLRQGGDLIMEGGSSGNPSLIRFADQTVPGELRFEQSGNSSNYWQIFKSSSYDQFIIKSVGSLTDPRFVVESDYLCNLTSDDGSDNAAVTILAPSSGGGPFARLYAEDSSANVTYLTVSSNGGVRRVVCSASQVEPLSNNTVYLGTSSLCWQGLYVTGDDFDTCSERKIKRNITVEPLGLNFINALQPVQFIKKTCSELGYMRGFIIEDVEAALDEVGYPIEEFAGLDKKVNKETGEEYKIIRYAQFWGPTIKAIQELNERLEKLENLQS